MRLRINDQRRFLKWVKRGVDKGWVTNIFCDTHDGMVYVDDEYDLLMELGDDPCILAMRVLINLD